MRDRFIRYLIDQKYKQKTPGGLPSTVYAYANSIDKVCQYEGISVNDLARSIPALVRKYDIGGEMEHIGNKSHKTIINALKRFQEFTIRIGAI